MKINREEISAKTQAYTAKAESLAEENTLLNNKFEGKTFETLTKEEFQELISFKKKQIEGLEEGYSLFTGISKTGEQENNPDVIYNIAGIQILLDENRAELEELLTTFNQLHN